MTDVRQARRQTDAQNGCLTSKQEKDETDLATDKEEEAPFFLRLRRAALLLIVSVYVYPNVFELVVDPLQLLRLPTQKAEATLVLSAQLFTTYSIYASSSPNTHSLLSS